MAANVSVPNSFTNGTTADAPAVNANFSALVTWINANAVHLDGSKAFTGVPSGPASDPVSANQLTRKAYVDAKIWANSNFADNTINASRLVNGSITSAQMGNLSVLTAAIADGAVTAVKIGTDAVTNSKIQADAVTTTKILDANVTLSKMAPGSVNNNKLTSGDYGNINNTKLADYVGRAVQTVTQSLPNNTWTAITFEAADPYDYASMHNPASNNTRVTCPVAGIIVLRGTVTFFANASGGRGARIVRYNSGSVVQDYIAYEACDAGDSTEAIALNVAGQSICNAGDYFVLEAFQNRGASLDTVTFGTYCSLDWNYTRLN